MDYLELLNPQQREAVVHSGSPLLILAGAGSGKTRVITTKIAWLINEKNINPGRILAVTFTKKAAGEMKERASALCKGAEGCQIKTFHSFGAWFLRLYGEYGGIQPNFTVYDEDDMKTLVAKANPSLTRLQAAHFSRCISLCKDYGLVPQSGTALETIDSDPLLPVVYENYEKRLRETGNVDFGDLILLPYLILKNTPSLREKIHDKFQVIMVDEYQDSNIAQFMLLQMLCGENSYLCVVGDDDQSIYKFRGANIHNILNFEKEFPDAAVIKLEQNYRSTGNILNAANGVIKNNVGRKEKELWTENPVGEKIDFKQFDTAYEEADYVASNIEKKVRKGQYRYRDCAVLYRTNAQSRLFEERFIVSNIPYKIVGGVNFYARKEIKDLLAYLKTIDNAQDDLAVRRIINVPKRGIGATTLNRVQDFAYEKEVSFYTALKMADDIPSLGRSASKIKPFVTFIQAMRSKLEFFTVSQLLQDIIEETGYVRELEAEDTEEAKARIENIDELLTKVVTYEESEENPTLSGFLEEVALVADIDSLEDDSDYVVLMTFHSAKGLEFPQVYLAGMEDGLFPSYMSIASDNPTEEIEEERRLCYVGITRAKENLSVTCARSRMIRGETQYNRVSRFVREIPSELLTGEVQKERRMEGSGAESRRMEFAKAKSAFKAKPMALQQTTAPVKSFASASTGKITLDYQVGDMVKHMKFGEGIVKQIVEGGRDYEVTVDFKTAGVKKMFAAFAKLKKI